MQGIIFIAIGLVVLILGLWWLFPDAGFGAADYASIAQLVLLGALLISSVVYTYRKRPGQAFSHGLIWLLIGFACVVAYVLGPQLKSALVPGAAEPRGETLVLRAAADGHFYLQTEVNGRPVRFMVDTGASGIMLPLSAAKRLGIALEGLSFTTAFNTANGQVFGAPVRLESLAFSGHRFADVPAYVSEVEQGTPLLGMRFLEQAQSIELREDELIIKFK